MKCFMSYAWESDTHVEWVRKFGTELRRNGVDVTLDQWDAHPGIDLTQFMERSIRESNYVLMICTPTFSDKANASTGGVGYEKRIVTGEIFQGINNPKKFIPILRSGTPNISLPSFLRSTYFIDFRDNVRLIESMELLLRHIFNQHLNPKPPLGNMPKFTVNTSTSDLQLSSKEPIAEHATFQEVYEFAYSSRGMDKNRSDAESFATNLIDQYADCDFGSFREAYLYAYSSRGMDKNRSDAEVFAIKWASQYANNDLDSFKEAYQFAYSSRGMDKNRSDAAAFAIKWVSQYAEKDFKGESLGSGLEI